MRFSSIALTLVMVAPLAACGAAPTPSPAPSPPAQSAATTAAPTAPTSSTSSLLLGHGTTNETQDYAAMQARVAQFAPAKLTADVSRLPDGEKQALQKLIAASKLLDPVFDRQAWTGNPELRTKLAGDTTAEGKLRLAYFDMMRGPWDRQDHMKPFATLRERPKGAGFYPEDMTADELHAWTTAHPGDKASLESLTTIVKRERDGSGKLVAVAYHDAYKEWLEPAAALLDEASKLTKNKSLEKFLKSRAQAFRTDEYYQSDKDWMDLDSDVEVTIGPYETYEDDLLGLKASYESFVTVSDPAASAKLAKYKKLLPQMEQNLPIPDAVKTKRGAESPIRVVDLVFTSADARKSVQTIAFNLPNDERVRKEKGAKKVLLRNLIETKFDVIMRPIGERLLDASQAKDLSAEAFFNETLFHELSHSLGPAFTSKKIEVRRALEASFSAIEEAKADVMGAYNILYMVKLGELPKDFDQKLLASYFAGLFRSVRFGVAEAHGQGAAMQINRYLEAGAAKLDPVTQRFTIDYAKLTVGIRDLVRDLCMLQHEGDRAKADAMLAKYGVMSDPMKTALAGLSQASIPVDIKPIYPIAGE